MIEHYTDAQVEMVNNLGSSIVQHQAMLSGDVDITATRYTGTDLAGALGMDPVKDPVEALKMFSVNSRSNLIKLGLIHMALIIHMLLL